MGVTRLVYCFIPAFLLLAAVGRTPADEANARVQEAILREAGVAADDVSLLGFLRKRTLDETGLEKIHSLVKQLGDRTFAVREKAALELVALGKPASPYLRRALRSNDPEIARRAEECLRLIDE